MILKANLYYRINGRHDQAFYKILKQKLMPEEENLLKVGYLKPNCGEFCLRQLSFKKQQLSYYKQEDNY